MKPFLRRSIILFVVFVGIGLGYVHSVQAQSLKLEAPAPLHAGNNEGLVDSFVGDHYYYFFAEPGKFSITFTSGNAAEGFNVGGVPSFGAAFNPKTAGSVITHRDGPGHSVWEGSVTQRTRVMVGVSPVNSKLVRQTSPYRIVVSGNVAYGDASAGPDPIVGTYAQKLLFSGEPELGAVKFLPNGTIISSNGGTGNWTLFDAASGIYSVTIGGHRMTLTLQRGRALVDTGNKTTVFELQR